MYCRLFMHLISVVSAILGKVPFNDKDIIDDTGELEGEIAVV